MKRMLQSLLPGVFPPGDPSLPLVNSLQMVAYTCPQCQFPHQYLPNFEDFYQIPHSQSTRIREVSIFDHNLWEITNYRNQEYYRTLGPSKSWYIRTRGDFYSTFWLLCDTACKHLEATYGWILQRQNLPKDDWKFRGYVQRKAEGDRRIWFCENEYISKIPPAPGFPRILRNRTVICENCRRHGETCFSREWPSSSEVFSELRSRFTEKYTGNTSWMKSFPVQLNFEDYPIYSLFDLSIEYSDGQKSGRLLWLLEESNRWIMVQSPPGFGKTALLSILALQWACNLSEPSNFQLCILLNLSEQKFNFSQLQELVTACTRELQNIECKNDMVEQALVENSEKILLLVDGFDMLSEESQHNVLEVLLTNACVRKSTILITTRPTENSSFLRLFRKHVTVRGFSADYLIKYAQKNDSVLKSVQDFCDFFEEKRLCFLSELSPYFTSFIWRTAKAELYLYDGNKSLYRLLSFIIQQVVSAELESTTPKEKVGILLRMLGKLLFQGLLVDKRIFRFHILEKFFPFEYMKLLVRCNIFYRQDSDCKMWFVSSKLLAVFFSTLYLREKWSVLGNDKQRERFLREEFCSGACDGDYVQGEECLYYVGLIPEIVLKFTNGRSLDSATFEMYYDVEPIEKTSAFDSVNLLSRVGDKFLGRFGFRIEAEDDESFLATFSCVFDFISVENCSVGYSFFTNVYENKQFMIIDVKTREDNVVLQAILRAKTEKLTDRIYIDFAYRNLDDLFEFVRALLSQYLKDFQLPEELKSVPPMTFIFNLVYLLCTSIDKGVATITCGWTENDFFKTYASFKVCRINDYQETVFAYDQNSKCTKYVLEDFINSSWSNPLNICDRIERDFRISINLF